uniref:Uncharacterized protein n=1 Tax=Spongospora subterranea TaxID=70186 RepID=A0A0H5RBP1_9EUKA|eukprot:CRZ11206.1 hypothetical protein [Spongospora subterranea]
MHTMLIMDIRAPFLMEVFRLRSIESLATLVKITLPMEILSVCLGSRQKTGQTVSRSHPEIATLRIVRSTITFGHVNLSNDQPNPNWRAHLLINNALCMTEVVYVYSRS